MTPLASRLVCSGCGSSPEPDDPYPFLCPRSGQGDVDHVLARVLDTEALDWPPDEDDNPFLRYRTLLHSYHVAVAGGMEDAAYRSIVETLDAAVAELDGAGFDITPFARSRELSSRLGFADDGGVWVKDETRNVSGSHKARHLMGVALHLEVVERLGLAPAGKQSRLAIASCGNAALAAAVVARAARRPLDVFVPPDAPASVLRRLQELEANINVCPRTAGATGDPTFQALRSAIDRGAVPFTCQGSQNGLVIEGGETLGWEIVSAGPRLDRVIVQVGGGALASSFIQSMREAAELGALPRSPILDTLQTASAYPLKRAYERVCARIQDGESGQEALHYAATHRSEFMWPWESEPHSIAHGILDDETYDWHAVVAGMLSGGGHPLVADEESLEEANSLARSATGIDVDHTGSSGLAALLMLRGAGSLDRHERIGVLFTGVRR